MFVMAAAAVGIGSRRQKSDGDEDTSRCGSGECAKVDQAKSENCGRYTPDFFNMETNLAGITWAHAVNSKTLLDNALRGTCNGAMVQWCNVISEGRGQRTTSEGTSAKAFRTAVPDGALFNRL